MIAFGLVFPGDVEILGGLYAFGATIAFTIAHLSVIRLRVTRPDAERPFRVPVRRPVGGRRLPLPAVAAVLTALAWVSVLAFHDEARWVGAGGWSSASSRT